MTIKLIATDMDGTFLREDKTYDKERFNQIAEQLREKNIVGVIASGNSFDHISKPFDDVCQDWLYFAGDNGNHIVKQGESIHVLAIAQHIVEKVVTLAESFEGCYALLSTTKTAYTYETISDEALMHFLKYNMEIIKIKTLSDIPADEEVVKIAIMSKRSLEENKQIALTIREQYNVSSATSGDMWIDVYHKDGGKGAGIRFIQEKYGIKKEECIAFGDNLNDLPMMKEVKYSVAMENADNELKKVCRYEIGTNEEQAVQNILEQFVANGDISFLQNKEN
ncbi:Cof-type HAD-IIB family hydrolase [Granulicatella sp. zg-ZJ]|uniref:HAD family hydrolase n=1 Tax=unclassified Granulicatella TaxID=2630493 RepID=UPI0013C20791|nr:MULTISPECIES: HAD family hydrolase [unclassified Granulicatella]MBS4751134.1 HAD family phosphatase [Carnobacteriaceae bacterium zg-ZUI78]NEW63469.1 Cof-type HAD-IIB family hydrolase [Granulicatella sp. zg-ZJ]NEW65538.1 Cof-type HAD-IIB family hydrolase [Granulicatella sp. zg-84]QMI85579.1 HAD family phosphatase [Carnobacteriaceae bacterium zg-84]